MLIYLILIYLILIRLEYVTWYETIVMSPTKLKSFSSSQETVMLPPWSIHVALSCDAIRRFTFILILFGAYSRDFPNI